MATAVFLSHPTIGHLMPARGVIAELVRRGERVIVYTTERGCALMAPTGAELLLYPAGHDEFDPTPATPGLFSDMARLIALCERIVPVLTDAVRRHGADYLLIDSKSLWGRMVAQRSGLPAIKLSVVFAIPRGAIGVGELAAQLYGGGSHDALLDGLIAFTRYASRAIAVDHLLGTSAPGVIDFLGNPQACNIHFTSRAFQPAGDEFGADTLFVGPHLDAQRAAGVDGGGFPFHELDDRPLLYISLGTTFHDAPEFYAACFEAFATAPWQIVLATGGTRTGSAPENFRVFDRVPQLEILERAAAAITHGGMNTANEALWHGVPLLVHPQRGDQHIVARRVEELGAGLRVREATPAALRRDVERLLGEPSFRAAAEDLGRTLRTAGGAARAADAIVAFTAAAGAAA